MRDRPNPPPWLSEVQTPPASLPGDADRPAPVLFDAEHRPISSPDDWARRRAELRGAWSTFLGEFPTPEDPPGFEVVERDRVPPEADGQPAVDRSLIRYEAEPGRPVEAYLLRPEAPAPADRRPGAVVLHSTVDDTIRQPAGLEGPSDTFIGLHLARLGYAAVCPRCFLWEQGEGRYEEAVARQRRRHPGATGTAQMLYDARRALDLLAAEPDVDPSRVAAIGHSLGAKEALVLAAFDDRVAAAVSSEGGIGIGYSNWDAPWYHGDAVRRPGFPLDHAQMLALVAPRPFLLIGGDSADGDRSWPYIDVCLPLWRLLGAPGSLGLFNHRQGHAFPPVAQERSYAWLNWSLGV
ncbi:dienelactone hydrolase family protein [Tautonia sociabilis]|uniref:Dienelactone hydrolase n=1 Tax=Tautonia sociabilis TaxID=2080755 RepID=A0A432MD81_9BACT|nr:dienelactone hydrolase family protein [Tautonia sociabilis]RUL81611.1 dienelactone hydrolase [Tautonia sociabilis]